MRLLAVPAIALALLLAACGDGDSPFDSPQTSPTVGSVSQTPIPQQTATPAPTGCQPTGYTIVDGDTILGIALAHDTTVEAIIEASDLEDPDFLSIGQELRIPCPDASPSPTATADEEDATDSEEDDMPDRTDEAEPTADSGA